MLSCGRLSSVPLLHFAVDLTVMVKSGYFEHQVNSDIHLQKVENPDKTAPYEPSHQDFHCLLS